MVANEFIAYSALGPMKATLDPRSFAIATFALCGFANFSSIGIQIGGIGALAPERKNDLSRLGLRALIAGTLANFMTACHRGHAPVSAFKEAEERRPSSARARSCGPCSRSSSAPASAPSRTA